MFKGYKRRVIVVKDTGSKMFDCAYFVLNENVSGEGVNDMVKEAVSIIEAGRQKDYHPSFAKGFFAFSLGLASASLLLACATLLAG